MVSVDCRERGNKYFPGEQQERKEKAIRVVS